MLFELKFLNLRIAEGRLGSIGNAFRCSHHLLVFGISLRIGTAKKVLKALHEGWRIRLLLHSPNNFILSLNVGLFSR